MEQLKTRKDYDFFESASAMQKAIRRSDEKVALFFATELYLSGYRRYVWKRLLIIASEDIGLAEPDLITRIVSLKQSCDWINDIATKGFDDIIPVVHAVLIMCRCEKSRLVDNAKIWAMKNDHKMEVPDYALDKHTRRGKIKGRGLDHFFEEGAKLHPHKKMDDEEIYSSFFKKWATDQDKGVCDDVGYDDRNVDFKSTKEMNEWKKQRSLNRQNKLF